jgi:hypothetical protein
VLLFFAVSLHVWGVRSPDPQEPVYAQLAARVVAIVLVSPPLPLAPPFRLITGRPSSHAQQQVTLRTSLLNVPAMPGPPAASTAALVDHTLVPVGTSGRAIGGAPDTLDAGLAPVTASLSSVMLDPAPPVAPPGDYSPAPRDVAALAIPLREPRIQPGAPFADRLSLSATGAVRPADRKETDSRGPAEDRHPQKDVVLAVVHEYARALERLDVRATKAVYPSVDDRRLRRSFQDVKAQEFQLADCGVRFSSSGDDANARCLGNSTFRPKVGSRILRYTGQEWVFSLARDGGGWQILEARVQ